MPACPLVPGTLPHTNAWRLLTFVPVEQHSGGRYRTTPDVVPTLLRAIPPQLPPPVGGVKPQTDDAVFCGRSFYLRTWMPDVHSATGRRRAGEPLRWPTRVKDYPGICRYLRLLTTACCR